MQSSHIPAQHNHSMLPAMQTSPTNSSRNPTGTPSASTNQEATKTLPLRSNMQRPRTTPQTPIDLSETQSSDNSTNLTLKINQLTSIFQSLITEVEQLEQRTSRNNSRSQVSVYHCLNTPPLPDSPFKAVTTACNDIFMHIPFIYFTAHLFAFCQLISIS